MESSKRASTELPGSVFLVAEDGKLLSLPIPSTSPRDPLNWSLAKRCTAFSVMLLYSIVGLAIQQFPGVLYASLAKDFEGQGTGPFHIDHLGSVPTLFMGIGCLVMLPLSLAIGRRPIFLVCAALLPLSSIFASTATSFFQLLIALAVLGFSNSVSLSTLLLSIIDITFVHQRPQAIALFWCIGGIGTQTIVTLVPHLPDVSASWRPVFSVWSIPGFVILVLAFFFVPETYFYRPHVAFDGRIVVQNGSEHLNIYEDWNDMETKSQSDAKSTHSTVAVLRRQFEVFSPTGGDWRSMWACYPQILLCLINPMIFWVFLLNTINFGGMMSIGGTYTMVLTRAPYNLPLDRVALVNLSAGIGSLLALPASGIMISRLTQRLARRNGGVRHAEHLLPGFALPVLAGILSLIFYGVAVENHWSSVWIYVSYGLNGFSYVGTGVANTLWVTEAFPRWAAAALAVVGGVSYVASFFLSYAITPWLISQGFMGMNVQIASLMFGVGLIGVPVAFWGQSIRQYINGRWSAYEAGALRPQKNPNAEASNFRVLNSPSPV